MISQLRGAIVSLTPTDVVLDVHGVGYHLHISLTTFEECRRAQGEITLQTHLHVREDALQLFGFATEAERALFRELIAVNGIGPRIAQGILSGLKAEELRAAISAGNLDALTAIPGVGKKIAERMILELRGKLGKTETPALPGAPSSHDLKTRTEALVALMSLGYTRAVAERALRDVLQEARGQELPLDQLVRRALRRASA